MNYQTEIKRFTNSHFIYAGFRNALAVIFPSILLVYTGRFQDYFLFPLGTILIAYADITGSYKEKRKSFLKISVLYFFAALVPSLLKDNLFFIYIEIILFGIILSMLGVFGKWMDIVGSLTLLVFAIFIDGIAGKHSALYNAVVFFAGTLWFILVYVVDYLLRPHQQARRMIGENYIEISKYLKIKSKFYNSKTDFDGVFKEIIQQQIKIKEYQEATRDIVFKTKEMVEGNKPSHDYLLQVFLYSFDLYEKIILTTTDYKKMQETFADKGILNDIENYLLIFSEELRKFGISIQSGKKPHKILYLKNELKSLQKQYFDFVEKEFHQDRLEDLLSIKQILLRITEITEEFRKVIKLNPISGQDTNNIKKDLQLHEFIEFDRTFDFKYLFSQFSFKNNHFKHAIRITFALLIGYSLAQISALHIERPYWVLISILAIMKPAYSITQKRYFYRLYGTLAGVTGGFLIIYFIDNHYLLLFLFLISLTFTLGLMQKKYSVAVFFMTIFVFILLDLAGAVPNKVDIFKERLYDTLYGIFIGFIVSYLVLPAWEIRKTKSHSTSLVEAIRDYFNIVIDLLLDKKVNIHEYKLKRKSALNSIANLADNFQKMFIDPKSKQKNTDYLYRFLNSSNLLTSYIASLYQYSKNNNSYSEIDFKIWKEKINQIFEHSILCIKDEIAHEQKGQPLISEEFFETKKQLIEEWKNELLHQQLEVNENHEKNYFTELNSIQELLKLLYREASVQNHLSIKIFSNNH